MDWSINTDFHFIAWQASIREITNRNLSHFVFHFETNRRAPLLGIFIRLPAPSFCFVPPGSFRFCAANLTASPKDALLVLGRFCSLVVWIIASLRNCVILLLPLLLGDSFAFAAFSRIRCC